MDSNLIGKEAQLCLQQYCFLRKWEKQGMARSKRETQSAHTPESPSRRKMLINMVFKEGFSIARTIKKLSLKLTTARFILQKYKESGTFPMKQFRRNARMLRDLPEDPLPSAEVKLEEDPPVETVKDEPKQEGECGQDVEGVQMVPYVCYYYLPLVFPS